LESFRAGWGRLRRGGELFAFGVIQGNFEGLSRKSKRAILKCGESTAGTKALRQIVCCVQEMARGKDLTYHAQVLGWILSTAGGGRERDTREEKKKKREERDGGRERERENERKRT
jgi:hypothetical protein